MASSRHLVITVHGIRTFGRWQERLEALLKNADSSIEVFNYKYGYFSVPAFVIPFFRWMVTRQFRQTLIHEISKGTWDRIDIVAQVSRLVSCMRLHPPPTLPHCRRNGRLTPGCPGALIQPESARWLHQNRWSLRGRRRYSAVVLSLGRFDDRLAE